MVWGRPSRRRKPEWRGNRTTWPETRPKPGSRDALYVLAAILTVAGGTALFVAIIVEVTGRMVLLIPKAWKRAKAEGRAEERDRVRAILSQYGRRDPETGRLVLDQDAEELLRNG